MVDNFLNKEIIMKKSPEILDIIKNRRNTKIFEDREIDNSQIEILQIFPVDHPTPSPISVAVN